MTVPDDIVLNKASTIERCLLRVKDEHEHCPLLDNFTHLDALILNLERACQAAIDMAMHIIAKQHWGVPQGSADAFTILAKRGLISDELAKRLRGMVGFRNIATHEYQGLDISVVQYVIAQGKEDLVELCRQLGVSIKY